MIPRRGYRQYDTFLRLNARMAINYQPNSTFDGPVLVVRSATSIGPPSHFSMEPPAAVAERDRHRPHDLGWSQLVSGPVTVTEVPGEHLDLLRPPAVGHVAASINEALAAARLSN